MFVSMVLLQLKSVLMSMVSVATKGQNDAPIQGWYLWPCWGLRDLPLLGPCPLECTAPSPIVMMLSGPKLLPKDMSGSVAQPQQESLLMSVALIISDVSADAWGLG